MPLYECVYIARQELSSSQSEQLGDRMAEILTENGGELKSREYWGLKNLAYRIKKNRKGHYTMFHIDAPSEAVREMERNMGLSEDILRYLIIRMDELPEGPSIMMQAKTERNERRRGDRPPRQDRAPKPDRGPQADAPDPETNPPTETAQSEPASS